MPGTINMFGAVKEPDKELALFKEEAPKTGLLSPFPIIGVTDTPVTDTRAIVCAEAVKT